MNYLRTARDFLFNIAALDAGIAQADIGLVLTLMYLIDFLSFPFSGYLMGESAKESATPPSPVPERFASAHFDGALDGAHASAPLLGRAQAPLSGGVCNASL